MTQASVQASSKLPARDVALLILIAVIWGVNGFLTKVALYEMPPLFLSVLRFAIALIVLTPFIKPIGSSWKPMLCVAFLTGPIHFGIQFIGIDMAHDLSPMIIAMQLWIPATAALAALFLGEKTPLVRVIGMAVSFVGVAILVFEPSVWSQMPAFGLVAAASVAYAGAAIIMRKYGALDPVQAQVWLAIVTIPTLAAASYTTEQYQLFSLMHATPLVWFAIFFAAIASGLVANVSMWRLVQRYEVSRTTPFTLLTPVIAIGLGIVFLDDPITVQLIFGAALALGGVAVVALAKG